MPLATISDAVRALRAGRPVLVADDADRENEGDVVLAAQFADRASIAWTLRHSSGFLCAPMPAERADALRLPPMVQRNEDARTTAYTVTVDARFGITTGISAHDRATTLRTLADPGTLATDLIRPGHIVPLRAVPGGVRQRAGHTEASVELVQLAGLEPVAVIAEVMDDDGEMVRLPGLIALGARDGVPVITIADLIAELETAAAGGSRRGQHRVGAHA